MITNTDITIYHKTLNEETRLEEYTMHYYSNAWKFSSNGSTRNKGYAESNNVEIRIPYNTNTNIDIFDFAIGDIIYIGKGKKTLKSQSELTGEVYNITGINNNNFGRNQHIHIGGK